MFCKHCGKEIDNDSIFCKHCGKNQSDNEVKIYPINFFQSDDAWGFNSFDSDMIERLYQEAIGNFPRMKQELERFVNVVNHGFTTKIHFSSIHPKEFYQCPQVLMKMLLDNGYIQEAIPAEARTRKSIFRR